MANVNKPRGTLRPTAGSSGWLYAEHLLNLSVLNFHASGMWRSSDPNTDGRFWPNASCGGAGERKETRGGEKRGSNLSGPVAHLTLH